jgi:hypothetical protein
MTVRTRDLREAGLDDDAIAGFRARMSRMWRITGKRATDALAGSRRESWLLGVRTAEEFLRRRYADGTALRGACLDEPSDVSMERRRRMQREALISCRR